MGAYPNRGTPQLLRTSLSSYRSVRVLGSLRSSPWLIIVYYRISVQVALRSRGSRVHISPGLYEGQYSSSRRRSLYKVPYSTPCILSSLLLLLLRIARTPTLRHRTGALSFRSQEKESITALSVRRRSALSCLLATTLLRA